MTQSTSNCGSRRFRDLLRLPPDVAPSNFIIQRGESLPLKLTVPNDGNGNPLTSLDDYMVSFEVRRPQGDTLAIGSTATGRIAKSGNVVTWAFLDSETRDWSAPFVIFYVRISSTPADDSLVAGGIITLLPL